MRRRRKTIRHWWLDSREDLPESIGRGPLDPEIRRFWDRITAAYTIISNRTTKRHPELHVTTEGGDVLYVGPDEHGKWLKGYGPK